MTSTQALAIVLYSVGAVAAIVGPLIAAIRLGRRYREAKAYKGTIGDFNAANSVEGVQSKALRDTAWGVTEFAFVALGVVLASVASIILVVPT